MDMFLVWAETTFQGYTFKKKKYIYILEHCMHGCIREGFRSLVPLFFLSLSMDCIPTGRVYGNKNVSVVTVILD